MNAATQKTQFHPNPETAMKSFLTMVAIVMATFTLIAPRNAWAAGPSKECVKQTIALQGNCNNTKLVASFEKQCGAEMREKICPSTPAPAASAKAEEKPALADIKDPPAASEKLDCNKSVISTTMSLTDNAKRLLACFEQRKSDCGGSLGDIAAAQTETATTFIKKKVQDKLVQKMKDAVNSVSPAVEACVSLSGSRIEDMRLMINMLEAQHDGPCPTCPTTCPPELKGHLVEFTLADGSKVEGEVTAIDDDTVTVKLADGTTKVLKKSDIKGFTKIRDNVKVGDKPTLKDKAGNTVPSDLVVTGTKNGLEVTGAIEIGTGIPLKFTLGVLTAPVSVGGNANINGNLHGIDTFTSYRFRLGESKKLFLEPGVTAKAVLVTGASPERLGDISADKRWQAVLGLGLKWGYDFGLLKPYLGLEGYAFPGLGVSGRLGTQIQVSNALALDVWAGYTWLNKSGVPRGQVARPDSLGRVDMENLRVGAITFGAGATF